MSQDDARVIHFNGYDHALFGCTCGEFGAMFFI